MLIHGKKYFLSKNVSKYILSTYIILFIKQSPKRQSLWEPGSNKVSHAGFGDSVGMRGFHRLRLLLKKNNNLLSRQVMGVSAIRPRQENHPTKQETGFKKF